MVKKYSEGSQLKSAGAPTAYNPGIHLKSTFIKVRRSVCKNSCPHGGYSTEDSFLIWKPG